MHQYFMFRFRIIRDFLYHYLSLENQLLMSTKNLSVFWIICVNFHIQISDQTNKKRNEEEEIKWPSELKFKSSI